MSKTLNFKRKLFDFIFAEQQTDNGEKASCPNQSLSQRIENINTGSDEKGCKYEFLLVETAERSFQNDQRILRRTWQLDE